MFTIIYKFKCSLFTAQCSQFKVQCSNVQCHSLFTVEIIHCSQFDFPCSPFTVQYSVFNVQVQCSMFKVQIQRSLFKCSKLMFKSRVQSSCPGSVFSVQYRVLG